MPKIISKYNNKNMCSVDCVDQNILQYCINISGKKWYFPILSYFLNICVNNAWLFSREGGYSQDMLTFTRSIVQNWLKRCGTPAKQTGRKWSLTSAINVEMRCNLTAHDIILSNLEKYQRCKQCQSQTYYLCKNVMWCCM